MSKKPHMQETVFTSIPPIGLTVTPEFITPEEEAQIIDFVIKTEHRRTPGRNSVQRYGSNVPYRSNILNQKIPELLENLGKKLLDSGLLSSRPDSITINEYHQNQGILGHIDSKSSGEVITTLSILGSATMVLQRGAEKFSVELPPRCLVQMRSEARDEWTHAILPVPSTRYSVVFRCGKSS